MKDLVMDICKLGALAGALVLFNCGMAAVAKAEGPSDDCTYQRVVAAYAWSALDDAERAHFKRAVLQNLEVDLDTAVEMQRAVCSGRL